MKLSICLVLLGIVQSAFFPALRSQIPPSPASGAYPLSGIVVDDKRQPLSDVEVSVSRDGHALALVRTAHAGTFSFAGAGDGTLQILARRLGYKPYAASHDPGRAPRGEMLIVLQPLAAEVGAVVVRSGGGRLELFYAHRKENAFGRFMDRAEIEKSGARLASDLFRTVPGASLRASRRYGNLIRLRGCQPLIWIDRVPIRDAELDEVVTPEEIAAIEIYSSSLEIPPQFVDRQARGCGAVVVWTRIN